MTSKMEWIDGPDVQGDLADELIINALANGCTQLLAAQAAGCSVRTIQRRLADPNFRNRLDEIRRVAREEILGRLTHAASDAVDALWRAVQDDDDPVLQVRAASALLSSLVKVYSMVPKQSVELTETTQTKRKIET